MPRKNKLDSYIPSGIQFSHVPYLIEIFPSPLPEDAMGEALQSEQDLVMTSMEHGYSEIFVPATEKVSATANGEKVQIKRNDFLAWQLLRATAPTLYHLANKTSASLHGIFNYEEEYSADENYDPETWLYPYGISDEDYATGLKFIERLRKEQPEALVEHLISAMLDEDSGVLACLETKIEDNLDEVRDMYSDWPVPLMVVSEGRFALYIEAGEDRNFMRDEYRIDSVFVRNCDEGDPN